MRTYRDTWRAAVVVVTAASVVPALRSSGWTAVVLVAVLASTGAAFAWCWFEDRDIRGPAAVRSALWCGCGSAITVGLAPVIGTWSLLVLVVAGLTSPLVVTAALRPWTARRAGRPTRVLGQMSDRDLERRWRHTTRRVRSRGLPPAAVAELVEERAGLLDELERRDPDRFAAWLVSAP
jgi:hypothetical protein